MRVCVCLCPGLYILRLRPSITERVEPSRASWAHSSSVRDIKHRSTRSLHKPSHQLFLFAGTSAYLRLKLNPSKRQKRQKDKPTQRTLSSCRMCLFFVCLSLGGIWQFDTSWDFYIPRGRRDVDSSTDMGTSQESSLRGVFSAPFLHGPHKLACKHFCLKSYRLRFFLNSQQSPFVRHNPVLIRGRHASSLGELPHWQWIPKFKPQSWGVMLLNAV